MGVFGRVLMAWKNEWNEKKFFVPPRGTCLFIPSSNDQTLLVGRRSERRRLPPSLSHCVPSVLSQARPAPSPLFLLLMCIGGPINNTSLLVGESKCWSYIPPVTMRLLSQNMYSPRTQSTGRDMSSTCAGNATNVFVFTCIISLLLQTLSSIATWDTMERSRRLVEGETSYHLILPKWNSPDSSADGELPERLKFGPPKHSRRLRVLFGILTADFKGDESYRKRHRTLFKIWNDPRVCSLPEFKSRPLEDRYECELIYTFVIAANPNATTELVNESRPFEVERPITGTCKDLNEPDMTLLNIR